MEHFHLIVFSHCYPHTHIWLIGVLELIRGWSLLGVSTFNDHPTTQRASSSIGSPLPHHKPFFFSTPTHSYILLLENQDIFKKVQLFYFCSSCSPVPQNVFSWTALVISPSVAPMWGSRWDELQVFAPVPSRKTNTRSIQHCQGYMIA